MPHKQPNTPLRAGGDEPNGDSSSTVPPPRPRDRTRAPGPGLWVVLEGIDGAGTTTQRDALRDALQARGHVVHTTAQPSDLPLGRLVRQGLKKEAPMDEATLALAFAADRLDHYRAEIAPALSQGHIVVCDRYLLSSLAYQGSALGLSWVDTINGHAPLPHLTLFLRVSQATAAARRGQRDGEAERFDAAQRQQQVADRYEEAISVGLAGPVTVLDGEQSANDVTAACLALLESSLEATP